MSEDGPPLFRPVPRRPFAVPRMEPTPPPSDRENDDDYFYNPNSSLTAAQLLSAGFPSLSPPHAATPISRGQSLMDLTGSTLAGIYSQADEETPYEEPEEPAWRPQAAPVERPSVDDVADELARAREQFKRRRSTVSNAGSVGAYSSRPSWSSATLGAGLLFALGVGYGVLLARLQDGPKWMSLTEGIVLQSGWNIPYLAFWGVSGVALGALLPWFDRVWEDTFGEDSSSAVETEQDAPLEEQSSSTDWALVMRAIGAFVGIVFAIRKLAWSSTLQVSVTLALVNPLLWWIIDRSAAGLIMSGAVGFTGSAVLLGVNPQMMPAPSSLLLHMHAAAAGGGNRTAVAGGYVAPDDLSSLTHEAHGTLETGVWMLSVLFCSCVCFGNIGRRLAWNKTTDVKGRWGGLR